VRPAETAHFEIDLPTPQEVMELLK
jgi:hypothetical protein